jgi:RNA polymerase sigma factor (sigma-70 family)
MTHAIAQGMAQAIVATRPTGRTSDRSESDPFVADVLRLAMEHASRLADYDTARDVSHEVAVELWQRRVEERDFLARPEDIAPYVCRAVANRVFNVRRDGARRRHRDQLHTLESSAPVHSWMNPETAREEAELAQQVARALEGMPARVRTIYRRVRDDEASCKEVAREMGISANTVRNHLVRAHELLRAALMGEKEV